MKVKTVEVKNFRCLDHVKIDFDQVSTFIGPNGAGKSTVLRALHWFFNGDKNLNALNHGDVFSGATDPKIMVRVDFDQLTAADRLVLGEKYAPANVNVFTAWRIWDNGAEKITGRALAFRPFETVRLAEGAKPKKAAYEKVVADHPDDTFPEWTKVGDIEGLMTDWEREHPQRLEEAEVSDTNLFGIAGQGKLSGLFDYVLISADLRAEEESTDTRTSIVGRIIEKAVDRAVADEEISQLNEELGSRHAEITKKHFSQKLSDLSATLTNQVTAFAPGRNVEVQSLPIELKPQTTRFQVRVDDHGTRTEVGRQGHGFQRSLLIAALKMLAESGTAQADASVIFLAIEEPELYQHPTQAKAFATVLRSLADDPAAGIQIGYATHSPYFIEARYFDQVRRVHRDSTIKDGPQVEIRQASMDGVADSLDTYVDEVSVRARLDNACLHELRDSLFASAVLLVEGQTEKSLLEGISEAQDPLASLGVEIAVVSKDAMYLPIAILRHLGIPFFVVFDSDRGKRKRMESKGKSERDVAKEERATIAGNRRLLRFLGAPEEDWPSGLSAPHVWVTEDTLESVLAEDWPEFEETRQRLVDDGRGLANKNAATYRMAARLAENPPPIFRDLLFHAAQLVKQ